VVGQNLKTLFPESRGFRHLFQLWHNHHLSREGFESQIVSLDETPTTVHVACYGQIEGNGLHRVWIISREIYRKTQNDRSLMTTDHHLRALLNLPGVLFLRAYPDGVISLSTEETREALGIDTGTAQTIDGVLGPRCHPSDRQCVDNLTFHRHLRSPTPTQVASRLITTSRGLRNYNLRQIPTLVGDEIVFYDIIAVEQPIVVSKPAPFLVSGFAHDANNHLLIASANVQTAERLIGANHPALGPLKGALSAITQTSAIYTQARNLEYGITPKPTTVDIGIIFQEIAAQCAPLLPKNIKLTTSVRAGSIFVRIDPLHLHQIITNLIINAREALGDAGAITLSATLKGRDPAQRCPIHTNQIVCVSVSDNGPGIELPVLETIFTPFTSTKSSKTPRGLGLAMVKTLVERNEGEVSATSVPGIGTTFTLFLPAASEVTSATSSDHRTSPRSHRPLSLLIADDEGEVREIFSRSLTARGHKPEVCVDGPSLIRKLSDGATIFDGVIVDDGMPGTSSGSLIKAIRNTHPKMPIIVVSGDPRAARTIDSEDKLTTFLAKPFTFEKLYEHVERITANASSPSQKGKGRRARLATE
jgi:CheY-like chemotaxis protein